MSPLQDEGVDGWPTVTAVITTLDRPALLQRAVASVLAQDYPGDVECLVVFDRVQPRPIDVVGEAPGRVLTTMANERTPGLAGGRNSGIEAAAGSLVAFCDDDDLWHPSKLRRQVEHWRTHPRAAAVASGMVIVTHEGRHERHPPERVGFADLIRSRVTEIHPSSLLFRQGDLLGEIGLVDEDLPGGYGEDYELLLRTTRVGDVVSPPEALVDIDWARPSYFSGHWNKVADGLTYILERVPEFAGDGRGRARMRGQIAFAHAASGRRRVAMSWLGGALRDHPRELRAYGAMAVSTGLVDPTWLLERVQKRGRGL